MNFLINEYIALLKEDGELDALLIDVLIKKGITPISKPQKGRQYGVDIAAIGKDEDGVEKLFLITVKQGDITRTVWDSNQNSVRQSLNEILETYISISLTSEQKKLPKKVIVATNGNLNQTIQITWAKYCEKYEKDSLRFDFWGIDIITKMVSENLLSERLFDSEKRSLLKKTLAFLELKDYDLKHYNMLVGLILNKSAKTKKPLIKKLKLLQICLNIVFKWSEDNGYLKSAIIAADKTIIEVYKWLEGQNHFNKRYIRLEYYNIHLLRRKIGIAYFNKVNEHYFVEHSLHRYSRNQIEYNLTVWEEINILASIGLTEIKHFEYHFDPKKTESSAIYEKSAMNISEALLSLINTNPTSYYPLYDDNIIDIEPAMRFLYFTGHGEECVKWLRMIVVGIHDSKKIKNFFPIFNSNYENLIDYHLGIKKQDEKSSMLLTFLADWSAILNCKEAYEDLKKILGLFDNKLNLQIWFPKKETEKMYLSKGYSRNSGKVKHSITLYDSIQEYQVEIMEEVELFSAEKEFKSMEFGNDLIFSITSIYHRDLPFPFLWRRLFDMNNRTNLS
ncbi:conserved hypothetical protein [Tenacibaculum litopenaei]|uniref:hypothetical protein n=1 Tax=Tenacibaculum litopenaei TaxID=396016 RepID=UPI003896410C